MTSKPFTGVLTALATPFNPDLSVDVADLKKLLKLQKDSGLHGVVVCGTTGESPTLNLAEKELLVSTALEFQSNTFRIYVGTGSNSTAETIETSRHFANFKAHNQTPAGVMVVTPYYNKPTQTGLTEHFVAVARAVPNTPVCLYNVPGRTGCILQPKTLVNIAQSCTNVVAIKEAAGDVRVIIEMSLALREAQLAERVSILSGDDPTFAPALLCGASGVISVTTHIIPGAMLNMWKAAQKGDLSSLTRLHLDSYPINAQLFCAPNPIPLKWALHSMGVMHNVLRPPLTVLEEGDIRTVASAIEKVKNSGIDFLK
ncbi:MAG: 4-hydroxy-tetrahydrodipicolinate synthase [Betaproteobacteria bacterium]|nr:4-hydroxy-tetrahydrodipicolinate synthase [Betaproteobacteria bacterium]